MNGIAARLRQLVPVDAEPDWDDVVRRANSRSALPRILVALTVLAVMIVGVGSALALTGRLGDLFRGTPVKDLTPQERFLLSEFDAPNGKLELIAARGSRRFYLLRKANGELCYSIGSSREHLTPAQAQFRPRFEGLSCLAKGMFPSRALPVLGSPYFRLKRGERRPELMGVEGFAADPVAEIGVIGPDNTIVHELPVVDNVFSDRDVRIRGGRGIVALDDDGKVIWVQCLARHGCGKYKNSPPPRVHVPPYRAPKPSTDGARQRASADGVTISVRGSQLEVDFSRLPAETRALIPSKNGRVVPACFKLVKVGGRVFARGVGVTTKFANVTKVQLFGTEAPFDGCTVGGSYGHTWNDAHGTHDLIEVPLTPAGKRYFIERAVARDLDWLARSRVFKAIRYAQRPFTSASAAEYLAPRVDPLASPSDTPPVGRLGIWLGPGRRIVLAERTPTGRRFFLELRRGIIYRTNLVGFPTTF